MSNLRRELIVYIVTIVSAIAFGAIIVYILEVL